MYVLSYAVNDCYCWPPPRESIGNHLVQISIEALTGLRADGVYLVGTRRRNQKLRLKCCRCKI